MSLSYFDLSSDAAAFIKGADKAAMRASIDLGSLATLSSLSYSELSGLPDLSGYATTAALSSHTGNTGNPHGVTKTQVGLSNVENTALSTWTGSDNIATVGTITTGTWQGSIIAPAYLGSGSSISTKYLRGDGTWQTLGGGSGTVTSVALSVPTGLSVSGSPVESSGTFAVTLTDGYVIPTVAALAAKASLTGTETLTNKTLTAPVLSGTVTGTYTLGGTPTFPAAVVQLTSTQTLTNKTLTTPTLSGTASGTTAGRLGYNAGNLTYGDGAQRTVVNTDGSQTLSNKTLASPTVTGTLAADAITFDTMTGNGITTPVFSVSEFGPVTFTTISEIAFNGTVYTFGTGAARALAKPLVEAWTVEQTLTDDATVTYNTANGWNAKLTIAGNRTLAIPTNAPDGSSGRLVITQDGTGGRALTLASGWGLTTGNLASVAAMTAGKQCVLSWTRITSGTFASTLIIIP